MSRIVGYTTGVFDMFHIGHLNVLRRAKEQCDYLIVGVSTDALCLSYKHKMPVIPYEERCAIIESIRYVDEVVAQTNRDKYLAWQQMHFQKLFVGSDWQNTPFFNDLEAKFGEVGVEIIYLPYTQGTNSTILREKLTGIHTVN